MLALADETWLTLGLAVLAQVGSMWSMWLRSRGIRDDGAAKADAVTRTALRYIDDPELMDALRRESVERVRVERPRAAVDLDTSMKIRISESQKMQAFGKKGL